jgi:hypothetical protein
VPRPPIARRPAPAAPGAGPLAAREPLALDPEAVARLGVVRVALDAVAADPGVVRLTAQAQTTAEKEDVFRARASLARRSAEAYAAALAPFVRPEALPPF